MSVEAWVPSGLFNIWFIQRAADGMKAVAQEIDLAQNQTPEILTALDQT